MAINLAERWAKKTADKFIQESVVAGKTSQEYEFDGVKTLHVLTITTQAPGDYTRTGTSRYGTPNEVQDTDQELSVTQDKAIALTIDKGNLKQQEMIKKAGKVMNLEIKEQFVPMFDKYCLAEWAGYTGIQTAVDAALTSENIVAAISKGITAFMNRNVPIENSYLYIGATQFGNLVLSPEFLNIDKLGEKALDKGVLGRVRGVQVVPVPDSYIPTDHNFMLVHKRSVLAPMQIKDMRIHEDPPGINGALLEARWLYDAFVLDAKKDGVYTSTTKTIGG